MAMAMKVKKTPAASTKHKNSRQLQKASGVSAMAAGVGMLLQTAPAMVGTGSPDHPANCMPAPLATHGGM